MKLQITENEEICFSGETHDQVLIVNLNRKLSKLSRLSKESRNLIQLNKLYRYYSCDQRK